MEPTWGDRVRPDASAKGPMVLSLRLETWKKVGKWRTTMLFFLVRHVCMCQAVNSPACNLKGFVVIISKTMSTYYVLRIFGKSLSVYNMKLE